MSGRSEILDMVRGFAILLVIGYHWFKLPVGWTGVDLFFVLSGYLMAGVLIDNKSSCFYFGTFYGRRIARIVPLYLMFLVTMSLTFGLGLPIWRYLTFTQNFGWVETSLMNVGPIGLTWSLAVEEQFYLILPLLVRFMPDGALLRLCVVLIALAPVVRCGLILTLGVSAPYLLLPGRMDSLFAGVLVACIQRHPRMLNSMRLHIRVVLLSSASAFIAFLILGMANGFTPVSLSMYVLGYSLVVLSFGSGLMAIVAHGNHSFKHKFLCAFGKGAYSMYLSHQSILIGAFNLLGFGPAAFLAASGGTIAVSVMCWLIVERPTIRYARAFWRYDNMPRRSAPPHALPIVE